MVELRLAGSAIPDTGSISEDKREHTSEHLSIWSLEGPSRAKRDRSVGRILRTTTEWASPYAKRMGRDQSRSGYALPKSRQKAVPISETAWNMVYKPRKYQPGYISNADNSLQTVYQLASRRDREPMMRDVYNTDVHLTNLIRHCQMRLGT